MGKVTVKHYLNTSIKEEQSRVYTLGEDRFILDEEETSYPVYLQITVNRKTTKLRSFTGHMLLKKDFQEYLKKGTYYAEKKICNNNPSYYLKNEIADATNALDFFYNIKGKSQDSFPIKNVLEFYLLDIDGSKVKTWINNIFFSETDSEYDFLSDIIKEDINPVMLTSFCLNHLKIDIYNTFLDDYHLSQYKAFVLFFHLMPKDKQGKIIGKMINWYNGDLKSTFNKLLLEKKEDASKYMKSIEYVFNEFEKYHIKHVFIPE